MQKIYFDSVKISLTRIWDAKLNLLRASILEGFFSNIDFKFPSAKLQKALRFYSPFPLGFKPSQMYLEKALAHGVFKSLDPKLFSLIFLSIFYFIHFSILIFIHIFMLVNF